MFLVQSGVLMHGVSIISHIKQHCWYYYYSSHLTDEETQLRNIKQVTQGYPTCDGSEFEPRAISLFPKCRLLDALSKETTAKSTINVSSQDSGSFLYIQVSAPSTRAGRWGHSGTRAVSGQASFLFWWLRSWENICRDQAGIKLSVESANVGVLA